MNNFTFFLRGSASALIFLAIPVAAHHSDAGLAMTLGRTSLITAGGAEPLSEASLDLVVT